MLNIKGLSKAYNEIQIFKDFNLSIEEGRITCLVGKSGSGKTTLLNVISNITDQYSTTENDFSDLNFSYIFQEARLLNWYDIYKNMSFVVDKNKNTHKEADEKIMQCLKMVDMHEYAQYYPSQLSGGMAQRVSIARAFINDFDVLLMDEPFKGLDPTQKHEIIDRFLDLWREKRQTVIYVTHDLDEALYLAYDIHVIGDRPAKIIHTCKNAYKMQEQEREKEREKIWQILRLQN